MKPTIPEVLPLIKEYLKRPENVVGGNLHIVLDDGNITNGNIEFCHRQAAQHGDTTGMEIAKNLLMMSMTQRKKIVELCWK